MTFLEKARKIINDNQYPMKYEPAEWAKNYPKSDCYTYAIGLKMDIALLIGDIIGKRVTSHDSYEVQKSVFMEEMEALGFHVRECETGDKTQKGEFKIYIEFNPKGEYHFLRQDEDNLWSHKLFGNYPKRTDQAGYIIEDPDGMLNDLNNWGQCFLLAK